MTTLQTTGRRVLSLAAGAWFLALVIVQEEAQAVLYDPFAEGGSRSGPWISDRLPAQMHRKIESAAGLIIERLQSRPSCASLFTQLGKVGTVVIRDTLYYPADALMEQRICWRTYAFTKVGIRPTWICRRMWLLPVWRIAVVLLHEALHHAGLGEWPRHVLAEDSQTITGRVTRACGF